MIIQTASSPNVWDPQQSHVFLVLTQCLLHQASSLLVNRDKSKADTEFPKVNFFGNQFPFRNQVQTVLAWAVKGGDTGKCGWKALTSKAVTEFSEECAFLKPLQTQSSFHRYDHARSANNQAIQTHPIPNTAWIVVTDGFPPINVKHPEFSI